MVRLSSRKKNAILLAMADAIDRQRAQIKDANAQTSPPEPPASPMP